MAQYSVQATIRLELGVSFTIKAGNQDAAEEKAQDLIDNGVAIGSWSPTKEAETLKGEWIEIGQTVELDAVERV